MFITNPALYPAEDGWKLKSPLVYRYGLEELVVPTDTFTDLASIPKWLPLVTASILGQAPSGFVL